MQTAEVGSGRYGSHPLQARGWMCTGNDPNCTCPMTIQLFINITYSLLRSSLPPSGRIMSDSGFKRVMQTTDAISAEYST